MTHDMDRLGLCLASAPLLSLKILCFGSLIELLLLTLRGVVVSCPSAFGFSFIDAFRKNAIVVEALREIYAAI